MTREVLANGRSERLRVEGARAECAAIARNFVVSALGPGVYLVTLDGRSYRVAIGEGGEVAVNGRAMQVEVFDPRDRRADGSAEAAGGRKEIAAPMPGKVIRALVAAGDAVEEGQGLIVVEAMKMQNEMKSPKAGMVVEVRTKAGATVTAGEVLVVIE